MDWKAFLMKPKHQCHSSQWGERVYGAQSCKERRLLCESMFVPIGKQTLILKMVGTKAFKGNQNVNAIYRNAGKEFMAPNHEMKGHYYVNPCLS